MNTTVNMKKVGLLVLAAALICALAVGGTFAYLTGQTGPKVNNFTVATTDGTRGVNVELTEPNWDTTGQTQAQDFVPGRTIDKDPTITNTGTYDAWAALVLSIAGEAGKTVTMDVHGAVYYEGSQIAQVYTGTGDTAKAGFNTAFDPVLENGTVVLYVKNKFEPKTTLTAFDTVKILDTVTNDTLVAFDITAKGFATQYEGFDNCQTAMIKSFDPFPNVNALTA